MRYTGFLLQYRGIWGDFYFIIYLFIYQGGLTLFPFNFYLFLDWALHLFFFFFFFFGFDQTPFADWLSMLPHPGVDLNRVMSGHEQWKFSLREQIEYSSSPFLWFVFFSLK